MMLHTTFKDQKSLKLLIAQMQTQKPQSAQKIEAERKPLAADFVPGPYDVICARGRDAARHSGNVRFRSIIQEYKPEYALAKTKMDKSMLVSKILDSVRDFSPDGGFVKQIDGQWYEVGDSVSREKIGQSLRDQLHSKYKSSTQAKKGRRQELRAEKKQSTKASPEEIVDEPKKEHSHVCFSPLTNLEPLTLREADSQVLADIVRSFNIF